MHCRSGLAYKKQLSVVDTAGNINWSTFSAPLHPLSWLTGSGIILLLFFGYTLSINLNLDWESWWPTSIAYRGFVLQGNDWEPEALSARLLFLSIYFIGWFLWISHSCMFIAHLSVKVDQHPFASLEDLLINTEFRVMFIEGDGTTDLFRVKTNLGCSMNDFDVNHFLLQKGNDIERKVIQTRSVIVPDKNAFIDTMRNQPNIAALKSSSSITRYFKQSCSFAFIPTWKIVNKFGIYVQWNSTYADLFNY